MRRAVIPENRATKTILLGIFAYEAAALPEKSPLPSITALNERRPLVGVTILIALGLHFYAKPRPPRDTSYAAWLAKHRQHT